MATRSFPWIHLVAAMVLLILSGSAQANIWLDENFEDAAAFVQHDGSAAGENGFDTYSANPLIFEAGAEFNFTNTGSVVTTKAFQGEKSYRLQAGQQLAVGPDYQDPQNGNFQIFQFGINVDPIPAAGTVATFRWGQDLSSFDPLPDHIFFIRLESDGSVVTIHAGEDEKNDPAVDVIIGTLNSTSDWAYITLLSQKAVADTADSRFPFLGPVSQGMHIFNTSETPAVSIPYEYDFDGAYAGRDWSFTVQSGTIYLDELYWDGGMDDNFLQASLFRPFDLGATTPEVAKDWIYVD